MIEECISEVRFWMVSHRLLIKTFINLDFLIIGSYQKLSKVSIESITVGTSVIKPVECVRSAQKHHFAKVKYSRKNRKLVEPLQT